jgi:hypothetical protein
MRQIARSLAIASALCVAAGAPWPQLCSAATGLYNETRCPAWATCMSNPYSGTGFGCAPYPNATICNAFQACPAATTCVLRNGSGNLTDLHSVYTCVPRAGGGAAYGSSRCSCKPGAPLPLSPSLKNVLIIGDSISLGYTPAVSAALADVALVQHAPFSGDGGAEESAYALQCAAPFWLSSPRGERLAWDLIFVNSGMHNSGQGADWIVPGQSGEPAAYGAELNALLSLLAARVPALLVGITSPMLCNASIDAVISSTLNVAARLIVAELGLSSVDLYKAVTDACGAVPQASCFGQAGGFCPHSNEAGYAMLAGVIAPSIRAALGAPPAAAAVAAVPQHLHS